MSFRLEYFTLDEFDSPDEPGSGQHMDRMFLAKLDRARAIAGIPFIITSGFRTIAHNAAVGGVVRSAHTRGYAADIAAHRGESVACIIAALTDTGFCRIGVGEGFIHVDMDPALAAPAYWDYDEQRSVA